MSIDLIKRAAERLARERVSVPFDFEEPPRPEFPPEADLDPQESWFGGELGAAPRPAARAVPAMPSREIRLDPDRLAAAGIVTPRGGPMRLMEELRIVKRAIVHSAMTEEEEAPKGANLVMVTSAKPGEGKSFVAGNLAMSIAAEKNLRALLIDTDFQNPDLSRILGVENEAGLIDLLAEPSLELTDVMLRTNFANLSVLPAGRGRDHGPELLASRRMSALAEEIAADPSCIAIFDAAPLLTSSEPAVLAFHVGQTVLVVAAQRTGRRAVEEALTFLHPCPRVGLVLNRTPTWPGSDRFGSYERESAKTAGT
jgi:exopolysaccharide/PEP-CTERM locus tyrosine autokinase